MCLPLCTAQIDFRLRALPFHLQTFRGRALGGDNLSFSSSSSLCPRCCQTGRAVIPGSVTRALRVSITAMTALIALVPALCIQRLASEFGVKSAVFGVQRSHKDGNLRSSLLRACEVKTLVFRTEFCLI